MAPSSPTVARWELALRIKARRDELGLSVSDITSHLGFSRNYWSAVENERTVLADDKFDSLMKLFEFDDTRVADELNELRRQSRARGWWNDYSGRLTEEMERFYGLEQGATRIRTFQALLIPGLLQTEQYARAYFESDPLFGQVDIEPLIEMRLRRQRRLTDPEPLQVTALVSEAALWQHVGSRDVQLLQLEHLLDVASNQDHPVELRMVPFSTPLGPLISASTLVFMEFASDFLPTIAWQEAIRPLGPVDEPARIRQVTLAYEEAVERSLSEEATSTNIKQIAGQISSI